MTGYYTVDSLTCGNSLGYLARRASSMIVGRLETIFADREVTFTQWVVLANVRHGLARTAADICRDIGYDSGALTRVVDHLEQHKLIERQRCCHDRRQIELTVTEAGQETLMMLRPAVVACLNDMLAGFEREEVDTLLDLLGRFVARGGPVPAIREVAP